MVKFKCQDCGNTFLEPEFKYYKDIHLELDTGNIIETTQEEVCPYCNSDMIREGQDCLCCGIEWAEDEFCEDCFDKVSRIVEEFGSQKKIGYTTAKDLFCAWAERHW